MGEENRSKRTKINISYIWISIGFRWFKIARTEWAIHFSSLFFLDGTGANVQQITFYDGIVFGRL